MAQSPQKTWVKQGYETWGLGYFAIVHSLVTKHATMFSIVSNLVSPSSWSPRLSYLIIYFSNIRDIYFRDFLRHRHPSRPSEISLQWQSPKAGGNGMIFKRERSGQGVWEDSEVGGPWAYPVPCFQLHIIHIQVNKSERNPKTGRTNSITKHEKKLQLKDLKITIATISC